MTRLFRAIRAVALFPIGKADDRSMTTSEAGRRGAYARNAKDFERKRAIVHQLCAGMGQPVPEVFR